MSMARHTRRSLIQRFGGTTLAAALLSACSSPSASTTAPAANPTAAPAAKPTTAPAAAPTTAPAAATPAAAANPTAAPAAKPAAAVVSKTGSLPLPLYVAPNSPPPDVPGGTVTPPGVDSNPIWQEMNKRVGANLKISITPFADYGAKLPTILASNDMPDMLFLP